MSIPFLDLKKVNDLHADEIKRAVERVIESGWYVKGKALRRFERQYASFIGTNHAVGVGNGLDALSLIFRAYINLGKLRPGDEVIVPANTFLASILAVTNNGLVPVFVDMTRDALIDENLLEAHLSGRTRAVMLVHLFGRCALTERIAEIVNRRQLLLIEDNAQAHGCWYGDRRTGSLGHAAAHSFYPGKNLGAMGDAGAVTTDDEALAQKVEELANYGFEEKYYAASQGCNSRLDDIQAAVLSVKLKYLDRENKHRRKIAEIYDTHIDSFVASPALMGAKGYSVYHVYPLFTPFRDELQAYLKRKGIQTLIHYPVPPHKQQCYPEFNHLNLPVTEEFAQCELSLPISPVITPEEAMKVAEAVNSF